MTSILDFFSTYMLSAKYIGSQVFYPLEDKIHYHTISEIAGFLEGPLEIIKSENGYFGTIFNINTNEQLYDLKFIDEDFIIETITMNNKHSEVFSRSLVDMLTQKIVRIYDTKLVLGNTDYFFQYNSKMLGLSVLYKGKTEYLYFPITIKSNHIFSYIDNKLVYELKSLIK